MFPTLPTLSKHLLSKPFKRSQTGLFHGSLIQFGNNVPFSKHKTRRTWLPNIQRKGLFSELLGREVNVKITARALRVVRKYGGLDPYVLNTQHELLGLEGMRIRLMLRAKQDELERRAKEEASRARVVPTVSEGESEGAVEGLGKGEGEGEGEREVKVGGKEAETTSPPGAGPKNGQPRGDRARLGAAPTL